MKTKIFTLYERVCSPHIDKYIQWGTVRLLGCMWEKYWVITEDVVTREIIIEYE